MVELVETPAAVPVVELVETPAVLPVVELVETPAPALPPQRTRPGVFESATGGSLLGGRYDDVQSHT